MVDWLRAVCGSRGSIGRPLLTHRSQGAFGVDRRRKACSPELGLVGRRGGAIARGLTATATAASRARQTYQACSASGSLRRTPPGF